MEVILREDIDQLGARGQVIKVADGFARNYLLPKRLAVPATEANKKIIEQERQAALRRSRRARGVGRRRLGRTGRRACLRLQVPG